MPADLLFIGQAALTLSAVGFLYRLALKSESTPDAIGGDR